MSIETSVFWATQIELANPFLSVGLRPTRAAHEGYDGRVRIQAGWFGVGGNVTYNATLIDNVRIFCPSNQRRLWRARQMLTSMGIGFTREYRCLALGDVSRETLQRVLDGLARENRKV